MAIEYTTNELNRRQHIHQVFPIFQRDTASVIDFLKDFPRKSFISYQLNTPTNKLSNIYRGI